MRIFATIVSTLLAAIVALLGMIWHKMPGKENLPALRGERAAIMATKPARPDLYKLVEARELYFGDVSVTGEVTIGNTVTVDAEGNFPVEIQSRGPLEVEVKNSTPMEVKIPDGDIIDVKIQNDDAIPVQIDQYSVPVTVVK